MTLHRLQQHARPLLFAVWLMALGLTGCSSDEAPEPAAVDLDGEPAEQAVDTTGHENPDDADAPTAEQDPTDGGNGTLTLAGETVELTATYWCEPAPSRDLGGAEITHQVLAHDADESVVLHAYEIVRDRDGQVYQRVSIGTEDGFHQSGDLHDGNDGWPFLVVEDDRATVLAPVSRGGEVAPVEAELDLPAEAGAPGQC